MIPVDLLTCGLAWIVVVRILRIATAMNGTTDHWVRLAAVVFGTGALAVALTPFYGLQDWSVLLFAAGAAFWMVAEKRRHYA